MNIIDSHSLAFCENFINSGKGFCVYSTSNARGVAFFKMQEGLPFLNSRFIQTFC